MRLSPKEIQELARGKLESRQEWKKLRRFEVQCWARSPKGVNFRRPEATYKCRLPLEHHFLLTPHSTWTKKAPQERKWQRFHSWVDPMNPDPESAKFTRAYRSWKRYRREALLVGAMEESLAVQRRGRLSNKSENAGMQSGLASYGLRLSDQSVETVGGSSRSDSTSLGTPSGVTDTTGVLGVPRRES